MEKQFDPYENSTYWKYLALLAGWLAWTFDGLIQNVYNIVTREAFKEIIPGIPELIANQTTLLANQKTLLADGQPIAGIEEQLFELSRQIDGPVGWYFSLSIAMWLWGAACGGVIFGRLGDQYGRARTLIFAVLTYIAFTGISAYSTHVNFFCLCRFLGALGLGGALPLVLHL